jgi:hypothetical protein
VLFPDTSISDGFPFPSWLTIDHTEVFEATDEASLFGRRQGGDLDG